MNRQQAEQSFAPLYKKKLLERAQRLINFLTRKIEKAAKKGRDSVRVKVRVFDFFSPRRFIYDSEVREIVLEYFVKLGFETETCRHTCAQQGDWFIYDGIGVSWRPDNLTDDCAICPKGSRLAHLVTTGQDPKVM